MFIRFFLIVVVLRALFSYNVSHIECQSLNQTTQNTQPSQNTQASQNTNSPNHTYSNDDDVHYVITHADETDDPDLMKDFIETTGQDLIEAARPLLAKGEKALSRLVDRVIQDGEDGHDEDFDGRTNRRTPNSTVHGNYTRSASATNTPPPRKRFGKALKIFKIGRAKLKLLRAKLQKKKMRLFKPNFHILANDDDETFD